RRASRVFAGDTHGPAALRNFRGCGDIQPAPKQDAQAADASRDGEHVAAEHQPMADRGEAPGAGNHGDPAGVPGGGADLRPPGAASAESRESVGRVGGAGVAPAAVRSGPDRGVARSRELARSVRTLPSVGWLRRPRIRPQTGLTRAYERARLVGAGGTRVAFRDAIA